MTYFYKIAPWNIGKLTLFQWQDYMEKIAVIVKLFQPREARGGEKMEDSKVEETKDQQLKRLRALATARKQKLLRKGMKI